MDPFGLLWLERGHWGVTTAVYLFFATLGGGAYLAGVAALLRGGRDQATSRAFARWAFAVALVAVAIAGVAILSHLANPLAGLLFPFTLTNYTSWITRGTWILVSLGAVTALLTLWTHFGRDVGATPFGRLAALVGLRAPVDRLADALRPSTGVSTAVALFGALPALGTVYTGFELAVVDTVPLWQAAAVLPLLFLVSGIAAGVATALAFTIALEPADGRLALVATGTVSAGFLVTLGLLWQLDAALRTTLAGTESAELLHTGALSPLVDLVFVGLLVSLLASPILAWRWSRRDHTTLSRWVVRPGLVAVLLLGVLATFLVRYLLLYAAVKNPVVVVGF